MNSINPNGPIQPQSQPTYLSNPAFQALPQEVKDQLVQTAPSIEYLNRLFPIGGPTLPGPSVLFNDSSLFYDATSQATFNFGQSINAQMTIDQQLRNLRTLALADSSRAITLLIEQLRNKIDTAVTNAKLAVAQAKARVETAKNQTAVQKDDIDTVNNGDAADQIQINSLNGARTTFINKITSAPINATLNSDGTYKIPPNQQTNYTNALNTFQSVISSFNSYATGRLSDIATYNAHTNAYNAQVSANNAAFLAFINDNHLTDLGLDLNQPAGTTKSTDSYGQITPPGSVGAAGGNISVNAAVSFPDSVPSLPTYSPTAFPTDIVDKIYGRVYSPQIVSFQTQLNTAIAYFAFLQTQKLIPSVVDTSIEPLLHTKPILQKILPDSVVNPTSPSQTPAASGASGLMIQAVGLTNSHIQGILGKANLRQAINNFKLNLTEERLNDITSGLQIFAVGQLIANGSNALAPTMDALGNSGPSLSPTNPAIALTFSLSLANRVLESIGTEGSPGIADEALSEFIQSFPELQGLTPAQLSDLSAAINLSQLLIAVKLLETTLGLPGLTAQLLLPLLSPDVAESVSASASSQNAANTENLIVPLHQHFITLGYDESQAAFLAQTGLKIGENQLSPNLSVFSTGSINQQLLEDSLVASLLLSDSTLSLDQAHLSASTALQNAIEQSAPNGALISTGTFRASLEEQLRNLGLRSSVAIQGSNEAVIVHSEDSPRVPPEQLNQRDLAQLIESQISSLLLPSLGSEFSKQVTQSVAISLFGNPHPDASDIADVKYPLSIINAIKTQISHLIKNDNIQDAEALAVSFNFTIQNSTDLSTFLERVMDPAYLLIYSANSGIMYSKPTNQTGVSQGFKQSIDMAV
jgi:hypothetical protein